MRLPLDFLLIGAQKCATSWLYLCLAEHPGIAMPRDKRERTYIGGPWFREHGSTAFMERYDRGRLSVGCVGDASVDYMYDPGALGAVRTLVGSPKVIASLRDPVDRMISGYHWLYRKGTFETDATAEAKLAGLLTPDGSFRGDLAGTERELVARGRYAAQLRPFVEQLGGGRVFVIGYGEIASAPRAAIRRVYRFLGVDERFVPRALDSRPKRTANVRLLDRLERRWAGFRPAMRAIDWINQRIADPEPLRTVTPTLRERLERAYAPERIELEHLLGELPEAHRPTVPIAA